MNQPPMTPEQRAQLQITQEMQRRTNTSIFDSRGQLKEQTARDLTSSATGAGQGDIFLGEYLQLDGITWAPEPDGAEHCEFLSRIVDYMAQLPEKGWGGVVGGPLDAHDRLCLRAMAMLYCTGKISGSDDGYPARSAAIAEQFFRNGGAAGTRWNTPAVREDVCRLIFQHANEESIRTDKRLQVFADALRYELCRLGTNTAEGMQLLKEKWKPELFHSGWAADKVNARQWMLHRGWH